MDNDTLGIEGWKRAVIAFDYLLLAGFVFGMPRYKRQSFLPPFVCLMKLNPFACIGSSLTSAELLANLTSISLATACLNIAQIAALISLVSGSLRRVKTNTTLALFIMDSTAEASGSRLRS